MNTYKNNPSTSSYSRLPGIDFLRAFAALWVFLFHYMEIAPAQLKPTVTSYYHILIGWNGVDLFFVISGFLIGTIIYRKSERIKPFMIRRFFRIYPAYIFIVILCLIVNKPYLVDNSLLMISHLFMFNNLIPGYGGAINGVLWTLGAEFQFYILAALTLLWPRKGKYFWYHLGSIILIASIIYRWVIFDFFQSPSERFFLSTQLPGMLGLFGLGFLVVQIRQHVINHIERLFPLFLVFGIGIFFIYCEWLRPHIVNYWADPESVIWGRFYSGIVFSYLVLIFSCTPDYIGKVLFKSGLVFIGEISYGIYLTHLFFMDLLRPYEETFFQFHWSVYAMSLTSLTLLSSAIIFFTIEKPFIGLGRKISSSSDLKNRKKQS